jgi:hypothetical protein
MIEQLRPLRGYKNPDIVPVIELLRALYEEFNHTMNMGQVKKVLSKFNREFTDFSFLETEDILKVEQYGKIKSNRDTISMEIRQYSEGFNFNILENSKTIFKDFPEYPDAYQLYAALITRHEAQDIPYVIDLLLFEDVFKGINL